MSCCKLCLIVSVGLWLWLDILTLLQALSLLHSLAAELHFVNGPMWPFAFSS